MLIQYKLGKPAIVSLRQDDVFTYIQKIHKIYKKKKTHTHTHMETNQRIFNHKHLKYLCKLYTAGQFLFVTCKVSYSYHYRWNAKQQRGSSVSQRLNWPSRTEVRQVWLAAQGWRIQKQNLQTHTGSPGVSDLSSTTHTSLLFYLCEDSYIIFGILSP